MLLLIFQFAEISVPPQCSDFERLVEVRVILKELIEIYALQRE